MSEANIGSDRPLMYSDFLEMKQDIIDEVNAQNAMKEAVDIDRFIVKQPNPPEIESGGDRSNKRPWKMVFAYGEIAAGVRPATADFTSCRFMRGPIFVTFANQSDIAMPSGFGDYIIFVRLDTDGTIDVVDVSNTTIGTDRYCDLTKPTDGKTRRPLYWINRADAEARWHIVEEWRDLPIGLHV